MIEELSIESLRAHYDGDEVARVVRTRDDTFVLAIEALLARPDNDPTVAWGLLLCDLLQHAATALEGRVRVVEDGVEREPDRDEIATRIKECFDAEIEAPSGSTTRVGN